MRGVSSGKQGSYRQSVGLPDRSPAPSAQTVWRGPEGRAWWPKGEKDGEEVERNSDSQNWGLYIHTHTNIYVYIYIYMSLTYLHDTHTRTHTNNRNTQTQTYALTRLTTSLFLLPFSFASQEHMHSDVTLMFTPLPPRKTRACVELVDLACSGDSMPPPPSPLSHQGSMGLRPNYAPTAAELWCLPVCWRPHEAIAHRMSAVSHFGVLIRF